VKPLEVRNQVVLGPIRCLYLTMSGMYYRLTRSLITVAIVALAVAFLAYMLSYTVWVQERTVSAYQELKADRQLGEWSSRLAMADPEYSIIDNFVSANKTRISEYSRWGTLTPEEIQQLTQISSRFGEFLSYFKRIRESSRAVLVGDNDAHGVPALLQDSAYFDVFCKQLQELSLHMPLGDKETFHQFISTDYTYMTRTAERIRNGQVAAIAAVHAGFPERSPLEMMAQAPADAYRYVSAAGYEITPEGMSALSQQAVMAIHEQILTRALALLDVKSAIERASGIKQDLVDIGTVTAWVTSRKRAQSVIDCLPSTQTKDATITADAVVALAQHFQRSAKLQKVVGTEIPVAKSGLWNMIGSSRWLILVSFLVCAVGICNTMFMSVTERFKEIATMKCLGAMDGFVMLQFVFEALIQGLAGSVVGLVLGMLLTVARGMAGYGGFFFESTPGLILVTAFAFSFVTGLALAALAVVGPAWVASRLAPMEAMRVE
jgi:hypothetical protein